MKLTIYQVDAFADKVFEGNPAAICPLQQWLPDHLMQAIAVENNLSETAFFIPHENGFHIRWFTPAAEVDLCGHATLASAHVLFEHLDYPEDQIIFESKSGPLSVVRDNDWLVMDFPAQPATECEIPEAIQQAFGIQPVQCLKSEDYLVIFQSEEQVENASPDLSLLETLDLRGVSISATSDNYDFVSRFFAPKYGINEDPVTGSSFTQLIPYWSDKLNKNALFAKQISKRGGEVKCQLTDNRVNIAGKAVTYMVGELQINQK